MYMCIARERSDRLGHDMDMGMDKDFTRSPYSRIADVLQEHRLGVLGPDATHLQSCEAELHHCVVRRESKAHVMANSDTEGLGLRNERAVMTNHRILVPHGTKHPHMLPRTRPQQSTVSASTLCVTSSICSLLYGQHRGRGAVTREN